MKGPKRRAMLDSVLSRTKAHYSLKEAKKEIDLILAPYGDDCFIEFYDDAAKIRNSYRVHSGYVRHRVCAIIAASDISCRSFENMSAEWLLHNICYALHFRRSSAADVDLDYIRDRRFLVNFVTWIMDVLDIE